ncbi:MAG: hypothetical protein QOI29_615 [Mycobacterium sp.]|jgi:hypothetical protein|nr:hypothetical protein [Mycobacterium sp.]
MTLQTGNLRRAVTGALASSAMAVGLLMGVGASTALADPADPTPAQPEISPDMSADEALAIIAKDYDMGAGGGQLSTLIHEALKLRSLGFKASNANREAIAKALEKRPNQAPLIEALKETIAYQRKLQAQAQNAVAPQQGFNMGQTPLPPGVPPDPGNPNNTGIGLIPSTGITQPIG